MDQNIIDSFFETRKDAKLYSYDGKDFFDRATEFYKPYQDGLANKANYYMNTMATFMRTNRPKREPDYISYTRDGSISSQYWYSDRGVIRGSQHWGTGISTCDWGILGTGLSVYGRLGGEPQHTHLLYGKASWEDFVMKTEIGTTLNGSEQALTSFNSLVGYRKMHGNDPIVTDDTITSTSPCFGVFQLNHSPLVSEERAFLSPDYDHELCFVQSTNNISQAKELMQEIFRDSNRSTKTYYGQSVGINDIIAFWDGKTTSMYRVNPTGIVSLDQDLVQASPISCAKLRTHYTVKSEYKDLLQLPSADQTRVQELESKFSLQDSFANEHRNLLQRQEQSVPTVVINAFAGPGAGKTTSCMTIAAELKKQGYHVELIQEYAKDLVYDHSPLLDGSAKHQFQILKEQLKRIDRLYGNCDFIVTDSPVLLNPLYNKECTDSYNSMVYDLHSQYRTFNFFVTRDLHKENYQQEGRLQSFEEAIEKDRELKSMLQKDGIYFGSYSHENIHKVIDNVIRTKARYQEEMEYPLFASHPDHMKVKRHLQGARTPKEIEAVLAAYQAEYGETDNVDIDDSINDYAKDHGLPETDKNILRWYHKKLSTSELLHTSFTLGGGEKVPPASNQADLVKIYSPEEKKDMTDLLKSSLPIVDVIRSLGYEVRRDSRSYLYLSENRYVKIRPDRNQYYDNSKMYGGTIIDFCMDYGNMSKADAFDYLYDMAGGQERFYDAICMHHNIPTVYNTKAEDIPKANYLPKDREQQEIELPPAAARPNCVYKYLESTRGIHRSVIDYFRESKMLYQDKDHNNCVFVSYDKNDVPVFACLRGTYSYGSKRFIADVAGNDYSKGFYIENQSQKLIVTESVIDAMSYMSLLQDKNTDIHNFDYLCQAGTGKFECVLNQLKAHPEIKEIYLAYDNDAAGRAAAMTVEKLLHDNNIDIAVIPNSPCYTNDWNDELKFKANNMAPRSVVAPEPQYFEVEVEGKKERFGSLRTAFDYCNDMIGNPGEIILHDLNQNQEKTLPVTKRLIAAAALYDSCNEITLPGTLAFIESLETHMGGSKNLISYCDRFQSDIKKIEQTEARIKNKEADITSTERTLVTNKDRIRTAVDRFTSCINELDHHKSKGQEMVR